MNVKSRALAGAVVGAAALSLTVLAPVASADPADGSYRVLAGVGSDTTEDVVNGLGESIDGGTLIASYNATGSTQITTRENNANCTINRPNGSSAGITALVNDIAAGTDCLDFARSSRGTATAGTNLTFVPFAADQLKVAVREDSPLNDADGLNVTTAQLKAIYECTQTTLNGQPVTPLLPQSGSGTRSFFLAQIGNPALGSCVGTMQEHRGTDLTSTAHIAPYSVAKYISQTGELIEDVHGDTVLGTIDGGQYSRPVYNVVETARLTDTDIAETFVGPDSKVCQDEATITDYGFSPVADCGSTTLKGNS
ncbi:substrate-binding domain-containing protein [Streptomyces sp. NPDC090994]|uniref:substrate-binding domain-containing protein n=1 Tax=Streptomyces sp. NPDC090994 TaxID=3365969 RepID=UPI0037FC38DE